MRVYLYYNSDYLLVVCIINVQLFYNIYCVFEQGAFWGLMAGMVIGVARMITDFCFPEPECEAPDTRPAIVTKFHYMYFAMMLFWLTGIVMIVVSLFTKAPEEDDVSNIAMI